MDDSEGPQLCRFGTPLEPLEENDIPSKKPVAIEDQIVTDENGRRRFHGAFTGGFSAGFWNTVGSLEGWKPQSFKSSRSEKSEIRQRQLPTDFMDDEDLGEFGIAPQRVQARDDFAQNDESFKRKRKLANISNGPIPGIPVLEQLLEPSREKVAVRLLRRMGWKPGQGIGVRQTRKEKIRTNERNNRELYVMKMYGCEISTVDKPLEYKAEEISEPSEEEEEEVTFAPDDFEPFACAAKNNTFGLGYSGLSRQSTGDATSHINLFGPLELMGMNNNKLSIRGQAFGVGALEEEDEDIYAKDDITKYDFSLGEKMKRGKQKLIGVQDQTVLEGFAEAKINSNVQKTVHRVDLKASFQPRNWSQRKTRFEPLSEEKITILKESGTYKKRGIGRHDLDPNERGSILEEQINFEKKSAEEVVKKNKSYLKHLNLKYKEREDKNAKMLELLSSKADNFVKGGLITNLGIEINQPAEVELSETVKSENQKVLSEAKQITKSLGSSSGIFRPFANNEPKQARYEKFIEANLIKEEEIKTYLTTIQPIHLSEWDRELERKEFIQARNIYKPLNGLMSERFVSKSHTTVLKEPSAAERTEKAIIVERTKNLWKPCALICKRFNIPEPFGGTLVEPKITKKSKFSVFDYMENSINSKADFVTPVIIPKHVEKPKEIQIQSYPSIGVGKETRSGKELSFEESMECIASTSNHLPKENISETNITETHSNPSKDKQKFKTELESRIEESRHKHPSEKKDLFRSIFVTSSDSETEESDKNDQNPKNASEIVVSAEIVNSLIKPSVPINILRNNSPPRGIFAVLSSNASLKGESNDIYNDKSPNLDKITFKSKQERTIQETLLESDDIYGPKVPITLLAHKSTPVEHDIDKRLVELLSAKPVKAKKVLDKWIEKTDRSVKKSKEKKEKKMKHKKSKKHKKRK